MRATVETRAGHARGDIRDDVRQYRGFHDNGGGTVDARKQSYTDMVRGYYDLVTDFYERGWGDSFHFAPRYGSEPFDASLKRHQHYVALRLGLAPGHRALDVGCGVGGPMREIARFSGASVVGINNNAYQLKKAAEYNRRAGLDGRCSLLEADFMNIPEPADTFDRIYAFEATCHAPDKTALFKELFRVLKPGGKMAIYEWCLTPKYDPNDAAHVRMKGDIEEGNGLPDIWTIAETERCFRDAGFEVLDAIDKAHEGDPEVPWYLSLAGKELSNTGLRRTPAGKVMVKALARTLETARIAPRGTAEISDFLNRGADALVASGKAGVFTPMAFFLATKPKS